MALAANALTTLATVKTELEITDTEDDAWLEAAINRASTVIEGYCGRVFGRQVVTDERQPGAGSRRLLLRRTPIESVSEVRRLAYDGTTSSTLDATAYQIDPATQTGLFRNDGSWDWTTPAYSALDYSPVAGFEAPSYAVDYVGGYVLPQDGPAAGDAVDLPADIEQACILTVVDAYQSRGRDRSVKAESLLSYSVEYDTTGRSMEAGIPAVAAAMLSKYRRLDDFWG